ncbi:MAG: hypothetical protein ACREAC_12995, partial [Blastocatellia bacterium]
MRVIRVFLSLSLLSAGFVIAPSLPQAADTSRTSAHPATAPSLPGLLFRTGPPQMPASETLHTLGAANSPERESASIFSPYYGRGPIAGFVSQGRSVHDQPPTVNLESSQGYLDPAPGGMDVQYAWTLPGGKGENTKIIDIEFDWNLNHHDLLSAASRLFIYQPAADGDPTDDIPHGTAVLGELVAADDGFGVTGIANLAQLGLIDPAVSNTTLKLADAINMAASVLDPGDVMLIEQQMLGPRYNPMTGDGLVPNELDSTVYSAIKGATNRGIIVVEPASNGADNLDDSIYSGAFDRRIHDSGAILVGAGYPPQSKKNADRSALAESDYGSRLDVQGWGRGITT